MQIKSVMNFASSDSGSSTGASIASTSYRAGTIDSGVDKVIGVTTDMDVPFAFTVATLQAIVMLSSKDCTVKVNSTTAPDLTINLKAGSALFWEAGDGYFPNPFAAATTVTHLYITTTASMRLQILAISN